MSREPETVAELLERQQRELEAEVAAVSAQEQDEQDDGGGRGAGGREPRGRDQVRRSLGRRDLPRGPKHLVLDRKEVYLNPGQMDALTSLQRALNRQRGRGIGERITENTLIRIAVDLLLARQDDLSGTTEEELRDSIS
ncbi:hypothetical protein [Actinomadura atramentaria]|uniref:hypothetical protein n=1 Tax=Actinomadura atramentaria TaxID=1990 RepID=UPI0003694189|nr:hypothetical protein [Actinomadura atramentaria]